MGPARPVAGRTFTSDRHGEFSLTPSLKNASDARENAPSGARPTKTAPGYVERRKVEKTFARLGSFRRLLTRHERYLYTFRALVLLAFVLVLLKRF